MANRINVYVTENAVLTTAAREVHEKTITDLGEEVGYRIERIVKPTTLVGYMEAAQVEELDGPQSRVTGLVGSDDKANTDAANPPKSSPPPSNEKEQKEHE